MDDQTTTQTSQIRSASKGHNRPARIISKLVLSAKRLEYWLVPGHCILCQLPSKRRLDLCTYCENDLPWFSSQCEQCGLPWAPPRFTEHPPLAANSVAISPENFSVTDTNLFSGIRNKNQVNAPTNASVAQSQATPKGATSRRCKRCKTGKHFAAITHTVAPLSYGGCAQWLVQKQKHSKGGVEGRVLAELLSNSIEAHYRGSADAVMPDLLIPVPLHWQKQWQRGHNQSALLARYVGKRLGVPVSTALVKRSTRTEAQQTLSKRARATNLIGAFAPTKQATSKIKALPARRVAIIDDVVTTGSTALALARVLKAAGANEVHLFSPTRAILEA